MTPIVIHADGTDCTHEGEPQAPIHADGFPVCPAGQLMTHVRLAEVTLTIDQVYTSIKSMAEGWASAITPIVSALAQFGRTLSSNPAIRALAAAAEERQREETGRG
jgi:hypothetical protein